MPVKQCSACGKEFECKVEDVAGCWCAGYTLDKAAGERLKSRFADCLCPECLALYDIKTRIGKKL